MAHTFIDGVAMHREHPDTFRIPTVREKSNIKPGHFVKVGFVVDHPTVQDERLWIEVKTLAGDRIIGMLANEPEIIDMAFGDTVEVEMCHVLDITR